MMRKSVLTCLALSLAACSSTPQQSPPAESNSGAQPVQATRATDAAPSPDVRAVDPAAMQALSEMGKYLQSLQQFQVSIDLSGERVLADGQKLQHSASADLDVVRPNKLRARMRTARSQRNLVYDGKTVTMYLPQEAYYSQTSFTDNLGVLGQRLKARYGVELPSADLFLWGTDAAPVSGMESAMNAGQDIIRGRICDHYAFRQGDIDWQIWIASGSRPLPCKLVITNRADEARPQSVTYYTWNTAPKFASNAFVFVPPAGAKRAEFVPLKSAKE